MDEKELNSWWQCYLRYVTSCKKKDCEKAAEMLQQAHANYPQQLLELFNKNVIMPLKEHQLVGEAEFKLLSAILESHGLGGDILWTLRSIVYEHLLTFASETLPGLNLGNSHVQDKLHACIRSILKMEQCFYHNWTVERKDKPFGELEQCIRCVLVRVVLSDNCESETCLLAGTAFGFFLHSFCDSRKGLELFLSAFPVTDELNGIKGLIENFDMLTMDELKQAKEMANCNPTIFLLNGLLTCGKTSVLLDTFNSFGKPFVMTLIPLLVDLCSNPKHNAYHTFSTLVACLKFLLKNLQELRRSVKNEDSTFVLDEATIASLIDLLNFNWSNPVVGVKSLARDAFKLIMDIHCAEVKLSSDIAHPDGFYINELCNQVMCHPWTAKGKYPPLAILVPYIGLQKLIAKYPTFVWDLSESLSSNSISSVGCEVYRALIQQLRKENEGLKDSDLMDSWKAIFLKPLLSALYHRNRISHRNAIRHMLAPTLKILPFTFDIIWFHINQDGCPLALLVTILRLSHAYGIHSLNDSDIKLLKRCLNDTNEVIREEAFATISTCSRKSEPVSLAEMNLLKDFLALNLNVDCASFRQQFICSFKALLVRLRNSCLAWLSFSKKEGQNHPELKQLLFYSMDFLDYIFRLVLRNLSPGGCYQRRQTCLLIFKCLVETFCVTNFNSCHKKGTIPAKTSTLVNYFHQHKKCTFLSDEMRYVLLSCILDFMDEIKDLSLYLLSNYFDHDTKSSLPEGDEKDLLSWALKLCCSPKTTCCQSGARFFQYLFFRSKVSQQLFLIELLQRELHKHLVCAKENLLQASKNSPMHGLLSALSRLFGDVRLLSNNCDIHDSIKSTLKECIHTACDIVIHILSVLGVKGDAANAPSFEDMGEAIDGIVTAACPNGNNVEDNLFKFEHQLIQSCCWLSLKEACLFLGTVVHSLPLEASSSTQSFLIYREDVERAGDTLVSVLLTCRHRGAIEACNMGFELFCKALMRSCDSTYVSIVHTMLSGALEDIASLAMLTSVTRRSAGMPLLIQTVTSSEPMGQQKFLSESVRVLLELAKVPLPKVLNEMADLPQARALHILQALIHHARFSQEIFPFLNEVMIVCFDSFLSPSWAMRNAGLQLFGGLVPRLLGQKKVSEEESGHNRVACDEFFTKWPRLREFLMSELEKANPDNLQPTIIPILSLLGRLAPATKINGTSQEMESSTIARAIYPLLGCPVWHVRKMAARDIVTLLTDDLKTKYFRDVCKMLTTNRQNSNRLHGHLLLLKGILENVDEQSLGFDDHEDFRKGLVDCLGIVQSLTNCPILQVAGMDVILAAPRTWLSSQLLYMSPVFCHSEPGYSLYVRTLTYWKLLRCPEEDVLSLVDGLLMGSNIDECEACLRFLNNLLEGGKTPESFWIHIQNLLCSFLAQISLPTLILTCQQLISDICFCCEIFPDATHRETMFHTSLRMANGDYGASVGAVSAIVWAIAIRIQMPENFRAVMNEDCIEPWTTLIYTQASPGLSEHFRLSVAKALNICGVQILESFIKLDATCLSSNMESCILRIFDATVLLLQDEQVDIRKETSKFASKLTNSIVDRELESVHSNLAIQCFGSYFVEHFHSMKSLGKFIWEKLSCTSQLEAVVLKYADENSQSVILFEQEDINVYAEKCFMTSFYVNILKDLIEKNTKTLQQGLDFPCVAGILSSAKLCNTWLKSQKKHGIGVLEVITQTKIAPHVCNLSAQLEVLLSFLENENDEKNYLEKEHEKLRNIIGFTW